MGVIRHKDVLSAKYLTAIISDSNDRLHFVPIKKTIGDFFLTELEGNLFAFTLEGARILTYREFGTRTAKAVEYDTCHYRSIQKYYKGLELMLKENMLPKMNRVQLASLRVLGRKERYIANGKEITRKQYEIIKERNELKDKLKFDKDYEFKPYEIKTLLDDIAENENDYPQEAENMKTYLNSLDLKSIVTPVGRIVDSLQDDLVTTKPSFLGEVLPRYQRLDNEHRGISNKPVTGKIPYLKLLLVGLLITGIVAAIAIGIEEGWFEGITKYIPSGDSFGGVTDSFSPSAVKSATVDKCSDEYLRDEYTPIELKTAVDRGDIDYDNCLSDEMKRMVDNVEIPKASPKGEN